MPFRLARLAHSGPASTSPVHGLVPLAPKSTSGFLPSDSAPSNSRVSGHVPPRRRAFSLALTLGLGGGLLLAGGCANSPDAGGAGAQNLLGNSTQVTVSDPTRFTQTGFLSDYGRQKTVPWGDGLQCWSQPQLQAADYDKLLITHMTVKLKDGQQAGVDPSDLKALTDYFHQSLVKALSPDYRIVKKPGPGVLALRIALTNLVPTQVGESALGTLVPYGFVAEIGSGAATGRPAGSTPYLGETGIELQVVDGGTQKILAECRDTEIGRKYAADDKNGIGGAVQTWASGYVNSFQQWAYAKDAFDKWSALIAERLAKLRGAKPQG